MTSTARTWRLVVALALGSAMPAAGEVPSSRIVTASATDSFSELRLDEHGNAFYVRTSSGVRSLEREELELARVGSPAPWNASLTLTFLLPAAARADRVFCQGTVSGPGITSANDFVAFVAGSGGAVLVSQESTTVAPGTEPGVTFLGPSFGSQRLWIADQVAMTSSLTGPGIVSTLDDPLRNSDGVWTGPAGALTLRARVGDPAPGLAPGAVLHQILSGDGGGDHTSPITRGGSGAFLADVLLSGGAHQLALYRFDQLGPLDLVAADGDPRPGGGSFTTLKGPTLARDGTIVFTDANGIWATLVAGLREVARLWTTAPGGGLFSVLGWPTTAGFNLAFKAEVTTPPTRRILLETDSTLAELVRQDDPAPGTTATFELFRTNPLVNTCGQVVFSAELNQVGGVTSANDEGVWFFDATGSGLLLVREGQAADALGFPAVTVTAVHLLDDGATNAIAGLDDGGISVFNDRSEVLLSISLSDGTDAVLVIDAGTQCELVLADGFESGNTSGWSTAVP